MPKAEVKVGRYFVFRGLQKHMVTGKFLQPISLTFLTGIQAAKAAVFDGGFSRAQPMG
jgi:hypothetical protein